MLCWRASVQSGVTITFPPPTPAALVKTRCPPARPPGAAALAGCKPSLPSARAVAQPARPMRSSDWLPASPLSAHRLAHVSLRPRPGARAACRGVSGSKFGLGAEAPLGAREAWTSGSSSPQSARFQCGGCSHPEFSGGAEPRKWAHEEEELGNGLLFTPPQTGVGKSRAGADGYLARPCPWGRDAHGRKARGERGMRTGRQRAGPVPRKRGHEETWSKDCVRMRPHEQVTETEQTKPGVKGTRGTPGRKEGAPETDRHADGV